MRIGHLPSFDERIRFLPAVQKQLRAKKRHGDEWDERNERGSSVTEGTATGGRAAQDHDERRTAVLVVCGLVILLLLLLILLGLGLLVEGSAEESAGTSDNVKQVYIPALRPATEPKTTPAVIATSPPATTRKTTTTTMTTTTTEDTWYFQQDYSQDVYKDQFIYLCIFWSEKQGFVSHGRTYGIGYFPYPFCEAAMYCCYNLTSKMELQPGRPDVDLPPRDAVRRMAAFKNEHKKLSVWLVVTGSDSVFTQLLQNATKQSAFRSKALDWMKTNSYDGIRVWWPQAPASLNGSLATFFNATIAEFGLHNRSFGYLIPNGDRYHHPYNTSKLAEAKAEHSLVLHATYPRNLTFLEAHSQGRKTEAAPYSIAEMRAYYLINPPLRGFSKWT
ncbi:hypothetical protein HPB48_007936 [Haemaphysalis longicornis]|uniref:Chitinase n=1 Tax=Haemaphysalis longicornis TaxID=44386 RepID=A0A9J6F9I8_HAELO|nr:hypothetical protein HPB48_007936 [Haemaphysalis longicornis]